MSFRNLTRSAGTLGAVAAIALALATATSAAAAEFPSGPVQLVVPWKVGGGTDRSARLFAPYLEQALGVPVNVVNIAGGGGWVAWAQMAKWDPEKDDHKIGYVNFPHVFAYLDPRMERTETVGDFNLLYGHTLDPCIWLVREDDDRFRTAREFIDYVKAHPNEIVMSTTAVGSDDHQGIAYAEKFVDGFRVRKVYANNDGKKIQEVLGGHTDAVAGNIAYYVPQMLEGKLRPIVILSAERSPLIPSVPTFEEVTGKQNVSFAARVLVAAPGIAPAKRKAFLDAVEKAASNPEYALKAIQNRNPVWGLTGEELDKFISASEERVSKVKYWELDQ